MIACAIAGALLMSYSLEVLPKAENPAMSHQEYMIVLTAAQVFQNGILGFFDAGGLALASCVGLAASLLRYWIYGVGRPAASRKWFLIGIEGAFVITLLIIPLIALVQSHLPHVVLPIKLGGMGCWRFSPEGSSRKKCFDCTRCRCSRGCSQS